MSQDRLNDLIATADAHMSARVEPYRAPDAEEEAMLRAMLAAAPRHD